MGWLSPRLCVLLLLGVAGCAAASAGEVASVWSPQVTSLVGSLDPLREDFNHERKLPRMVVLLSPSCLQSNFRLDAVAESVLERFDGVQMRVFVVWVELMPGDDAAAAERASHRVRDARVRYYHDPQQRAARKFARGLLPVGVARDLFLFYGPGDTWEGRPPSPRYWSHQMGRVETKHFYTNGELHVQLERSMRTLLGD